MTFSKWRETTLLQRRLAAFADEPKVLRVFLGGRWLLIAPTPIPISIYALSLNLVLTRCLKVQPAKNSMQPRIS